MLFLIAGILLGILTGLIPGLHSNTIGSALLGTGISGEEGAVLIIAMFAANAIFSFIPSIFLGIPDESVALSVLPGQRMVKKGRGIDALKIMCVSAFLAVLLAVALLPLSQILYPIVYSAVRPYLFYILIIASGVLLLRSRSPLRALLIFALAGALGKFALEGEMLDPFLPLFAGMFAISAMLTYKKGGIPKQKEGRIGFNVLPYVFGGVLLGWMADLLPGISTPAQMASFASILVPFGAPAYLALISAIGTSEGVFALSTASTIGKARVGAVAQAADLVNIQSNLPVLVGAFLISAAVAAVVIYFARSLAMKFGQADLGAVNKMLMVYLALLVLVLDGVAGILILAPSVVIGLLCLRVGAERTNLMGAIIVPTILLLA